MERLTKRRQDGRAGFAVSGTPAENMCKFPIILDKLCEYEDLEEVGKQYFYLMKKQKST